MTCDKCKKECLENELTNGICCDCLKNNKNEIQHPMHWFNFCKFFRYPFSIFINSINLLNIFLLSTEGKIIYTPINIVVIILNVLMLIYISITYSFFFSRRKIGYNFLIGDLIAELFYTPFISMFNNYASCFILPNISELITEYALTLTIFGVIWTLPNYIYFKKRMNYFYTQNNSSFVKEELSNTMISKYTTITNETPIETKTIKKNKCKSNKNNRIFNLILLLTLIVETIILIIFIFFICDIKSKLTNEQIQKKSLQSEIDNIEFYKKEYLKNIDKLSFMDEYIVIVPADTNIYHKYDCKYLDLSSFLVFNTENAKAEGFKACKHCIK